MKLLKNGFAFIIAMLTISLTIAAHAGAFKKESKKVAKQPTCNYSAREISYLSALFVPNLTQCDQTFNGNLCDDPPSIVYGTIPSYTTFTCPTADPLELCCANALAACPTDPNKFRVDLSDIICGRPPQQ